MTAGRNIAAPAGAWLTLLCALCWAAGPGAAWAGEPMERPVLIGALTASWGDPPTVTGLRDGLIELGLRGAYPDRPGYFVIGEHLDPMPFDGGTLYPHVDMLASFTTDDGGTAMMPLEWRADPSLCGQEIWIQAIIFDDPGAAGALHTAQTGYVLLSFGE